MTTALQPTPLPPDHAPMPGATAPPPRSRWRRTPSVTATVARRLAVACAQESLPPERFGFRYPTAVKLFRIVAALHRRYFRVECHDIDRLPRGAFMLIANHGSHVLAWDGAMILATCLLDADPPRLVHGMAEHRLMSLPVIGTAARRIGATDGRRPICMDLLRAGAVVLTFPEGVNALRRPFRERYRLRAFGHGFMHVALATGVPIVPVAVVGAEEEAPIVANPSWLARALRTPVAPLTPTVIFPLPVKYRIHFGPPLRFRGPATPDAVARHVATARAALQDLVDQGLARRRHVFF